MSGRHFQRPDGSKEVSKPALRAARLQLDLRPFRPASAPLAPLVFSRTRPCAYATAVKRSLTRKNASLAAKNHVVCSPGADRLATAPLKDGYIRLKEPSEEIFKCLDPKHCRNSRCVPGLGRVWMEMWMSPE